MTIQWFPGHMAKARRQIEEKLKLIDLAIELLDARIPLSSRNPMIDEIIKQKPRLVLLNKCDLADPAVTGEWTDYFAGRGLQALPVDSLSGYNVDAILPLGQKILAEQIEKRRKKGLKPRAIRGLIIGIPNVGKSTLINRLAGRKIAETGDRPGVTKGQQWIKTGAGLELLDTPGVLWPKFEDQEVGVRLAITGAIKEEILSTGDIAFAAVQYLVRHYGTALGERYSLTHVPAPEEAADRETVIAVMEQIGRVRGCLKSGGVVDLEKASSVILRDLRSGKLGKISLERPSEGL